MKYSIYVIFFISTFSTRVNAEDDNFVEKSSTINLPTISVVANIDILESSKTSLKMNLENREIPQSISFITKEMMENKALFNTQDLLNKTPGVFVKIYDTSRITYYARGQKIRNFQIDGVNTPFGIEQSNALDLADLAPYDHVDVIHGGAGLTTGAGNPSAVVNFIRKRPTNEIKGNGSISYGSWNSKRAEIDFGGPILGNEKIRAIGGVAFENKETFYDYQKNHKSVIYGLLESDLTDNTVLSLGADYLKIENFAPTRGGQRYFYSDGSRTNYPRGKNLASRNSFINKENLNLFMNLKHNINDSWKMSANLNYQSLSMGALWVTSIGFPNKYNVSGTGTHLFIAEDEQAGKNINFDVNLNGKFDFLNRTHDLIFGWNKTKSSLDNIIHLNYKTKDMNKFITDVENWNGYYNYIPTPKTGEVINTITMQDAKYLALRFSVLDNLKIITGGSFNNWEVEGSDIKVKNHFTPYTGLVYEINKNNSFYTSYTEVYTPGSARGLNERFLEPSVGKISEIGLKSNFFDNNFSSSISIYKGKQVNIAKAIGRPINSGKEQSTFDDFSAKWGVIPARSTGVVNLEGVDLEFNGNITSNWFVGGGYSFSKAIEELNNKPIDNSVPNQLFHFYTTYKLSGFFDNTIIGGGVDMYSQINTDITHLDGTSGRIEQNPYALFNLMMKYNFNSDYSVSLNVNNLLDKHYYNNLDFDSSYVYGEPRNVILSLRAKF